MLDMQKLLETKNRILQVIKERGPELPVRVASTVGQSNLFTAAFMSELVREQKLKISNMKVGGSPLYYISGQEEQLQRYYEYLNHKEKEAFKLLKEKEVLSDSEQEPAIRVALRNIKDFAFPIKIIDNNEEKTFWKIHILTNEKAKELIEIILKPKKQEEKEIKQHIIEEHKKESLKNKEEIKNNEKSGIIEEEKPQIKTENLKKIEKDENLNIFNNPLKNRIKKKTKEINSEFLDGIKEHLSTKNIEILSEIVIKKKEFVAKITLDTDFGKQEFYLIAKDKKKITLEDLVNALQKTQLEKMPALIISPGEIDKKAIEYYKEWSNLIKHQKISI